MQLGMQSQHKQQKKKEIPQDKSKKESPKKKPNPPPKEEKKKRHSKKSAQEAKDRLSNIVETQPDIASSVAVTAPDRMSMQGLISLLLTVILCITLSYLAVTFGADKLTMHWMGV